MLIAGRRLGRIRTSDPINKRHRLAKGLVTFYLPLPGLCGGQTLYDLTRLNPATLVSMNNANNGWRTQGAPGVLPGAFGSILFDGTAGYLNSPSPYPYVTFPATLACVWMSTANLAAGVRARLINVSAGGNDGYGLDLDNNVPTNLSVTLNGVNAYDFTTLQPSANTWYFSAATFDADNGTATGYMMDLSTAKMASATHAIGAHLAGSTQLFVGQNGSGTNFLAGSMSMAAHWSRVLSANELYELAILHKMQYPGFLNRRDDTIEFLLRSTAGAAVARLLALLGVGT